MDTEAYRRPGFDNYLQISNLAAAILIIEIIFLVSTRKSIGCHVGSLYLAVKSQPDRCANYYYCTVANSLCLLVASLRLEL